jgi:glycerophosphoryl diester phosphodiesterase
MTQLPSLRKPPIGFAHRGASAHAPENTIEAFTLALRLGTSGLESDVWVTEDGQAVLDHDGLVGGRLRRKRIADVARTDLPDHIPTLSELYEACGADYELSLDVKDDAAIDAVVQAARAAGAAERLWLCHPDWTVVAEWRKTYRDVKLVDSTRLRAMRSGPERRAAELAAAGVDAVNMHHTDWSGGLATLFHRFGILAFGWDAQFERVISNLVAMGLDAIYSDHADRLVETIPES